MKAKTDRVIHTLVKKKKELLNELLVQSIQTVIEDSDKSPALTLRKKLVVDLHINDRNLQQREDETGISAESQEKKQLKEIKQILVAIQENNNRTIFKMEEEKKTLDTERANLDKENKLSGYISHQKNYKNLGQPDVYSNRQAEQRSVIRGTL